MGKVCLAVPLALLGALAMGCGSSDETPVVDGDDGLTWSFNTPEFTVQPGDQFDCHYTSTITTEEHAVWGATSLQSPGGHHVLVYYTKDIREPESHECNDNDRVNLNQIAGSSGQDVGGEVLGLKQDLADVFQAANHMKPSARGFAFNPGAKLAFEPGKRWNDRAIFLVHLGRIESLVESSRGRARVRDQPHSAYISIETMNRPDLVERYTQLFGD